MSEPTCGGRLIARRAALTSGAILHVFAASGGLIFRTLGISMAAFRIAGGLLLLRTALGMMEPHPFRVDQPTADVAVFPLAVPLLSGPGALVTVMVLMSRQHAWPGGAAIVLSIMVTTLLTWLVLRGAVWFEMRARVPRGVLTRLMGLLVAAIAVEFVVSGIRDVIG